MASAYEDRPIIVKKVKKAGHAHHGGAWKIAYADFVTAMMAFFLLLWLISMTTDEQKKGLADYFAPPNVSQTTSGAGGILAGTAVDDTGAKQVAAPVADNKQNATTMPEGLEAGTQPTPTGDGKEALKQASQTDVKSSYDQQFASAAASIRQAWQAMPNITDIQDNLMLQMTDKGLNILIVDREGRRMFPEGSKYPYEITRKAIAAIAPILSRLHNQVEISGHTAAGSVYDNPRYGSWELSSDRANVVRTILGEFGLADDHFQSVIGRSTTEPFFANDPYMPGNERIEITVLNDSPPVPPGMTP